MTEKLGGCDSKRKGASWVSNQETYFETLPETIPSWRSSHFFWVATASILIELFKSLTCPVTLRGKSSSSYLPVASPQRKPQISHHHCSWLHLQQPRCWWAGFPNCGNHIVIKSVSVKVLTTPVMGTRRNPAYAHTRTENSLVRLVLSNPAVATVVSVCDSSLLIDDISGKFTVSGWGSVSPQHPKPCCVCFSFVSRTTLVTHQCLSYCWAVLAKHQHLRFSLCRCWK